MGRRGPAPQPTRLKLIKGAQRKRINLDEPQPIAGRAVVRPPYLSPLAAEEWARVEADLLAMGTLTAVDVTALAVYCEAVGRWRRLADLAAQSPPVVRRDDGAMVKNPVYSQVRDAAIEVRLYAREFGLTPSARAGIRVDHHIHGDAARLLTNG